MYDGLSSRRRPARANKSRKKEVPGFEPWREIFDQPPRNQRGGRNANYSTIKKHASGHAG